MCRRLLSLFHLLQGNLQVDGVAPHTPNDEQDAARTRPIERITVTQGGSALALVVLPPWFFFYLLIRGVPRGLLTVRFNFSPKDPNEKRYYGLIHSEATRLGVDPGAYAKGIVVDRLKAILRERAKSR